MGDFINLMVSRVEANYILKHTLPDLHLRYCKVISYTLASHIIHTSHNFKLKSTINGHQLIWTSPSQIPVSDDPIHKRQVCPQINWVILRN